MFLSQILMPGGGPAIITRRNREKTWAVHGGVSGRRLAAAAHCRSEDQGWTADALARGMTCGADQRVGYMNPCPVMLF